MKRDFKEDFHIALRQARIAMHRGDVAQSERWTQLAERHLDIGLRYRQIRLDMPMDRRLAPRRGR
ncbi:MAG TPA: hypothetical protein VGO52_12570 [Hyphomonadaceae bacterium]|jgi:hypothetical protein|nr:hypothetical protein [Hyphomonadaceae bacterium]